MAGKRKRYGGAGHRNPDGKAYEGHKRPWAARPIPSDFRERYLEMGWDCEYYFETNWRVMRRWIDESGGEELIAARKKMAAIGPIMSGMPMGGTPRSFRI